MPNTAVKKEQQNPQSSLGDSQPFASRPISVSLGVNTQWQAETASQIEVPPFNGSSQIAQMALMFSLWSEVEMFLYDECQLQPLAENKAELKNLGILRESESSVICLLCLLNNQAYTAGGLVDAMINRNSSADQRGNARKRLLSRTLPVLADRYGLLQYQAFNKGNLKEYRISRSARLAVFAEQHLVAGVQQICAGEFTQPDQNHQINQPEAAPDNAPIADGESK